MLVFFPQGRLGNQLFQYAFLESFCSPGESIVTERCRYFDLCLPRVQRYVFVPPRVRIFLQRHLPSLAESGVLSSVRQDTVPFEGFRIESDHYTKTTGLLDRITWVEGFFQSERFFEDAPRIRETFLCSARRFVATLPADSEKVFVHIRRGDYLGWSVVGTPNPSLPLTYFKDRIQWFRAHLRRPFFVFLTDDVAYVEREFADLQNKALPGRSVEVDLAIMSLCRHAVLSNSTLAWWGAYLMRDRGRLFGPRYWLGWKRGIWYPGGIELPFVTYVDVE